MEMYLSTHPGDERLDGTEAEKRFSFPVTWTWIVLWCD